MKVVTRAEFHADPAAFTRIAMAGERVEIREDGRLIGTIVVPQHALDEVEEATHAPRATPTFALSFVPLLVAVAKSKGYALTLHGSLSRDFDFVAIPWTEEAVDPEELIAAFRSALGGVRGDKQANEKPHGRLGWTIFVARGVYCDISVMPRLAPAAKEGA